MKNSAFDANHLRKLAAAAIEGRATEAQLSELTELLRGNPAAIDEYLKIADLHAVLVTNTTFPKQVAVGDEVGDRQLRKRLSLNLQIGVSIAALAACFLLALMFIPSRPDLKNEIAFASIAQITNVDWESREFSVGERIGTSSVMLKSGFVRLEFDSGVEVTLEGPAEYQLVGDRDTFLKSGLLTANVPPGAEGFRVDTPVAQVVDLGTSFGIDIGEEGDSRVTVFDGEVEVSPLKSESKRLLVGGESIRVRADAELEDIGFESQKFARIWPTASGIGSASDSIQFVPPWPKQIRFVQSDNEIFIRPEGPPVRLEDDLEVNISEPSAYELLGDLTPSTLQSEQVVRSYIMHFSPKSQLGPRRAKRVTGSVTFNRPVLGMVVRHEELVASSRRFGRRGAGEVNQRRELSFTGDELGDRVSLSADRRTVTLDLVSPGRSSDLIRVIVDGRPRSRRERLFDGER